VPAIKFKIIY